MNATTADTATIATPAGSLTIIARDEVVLAAGYAPAAALLPLIAAVLRPEGLHQATDLGAITEAVRAYGDGDLAAIDTVAVRQRSGPFRERAWDALRRVAPGTTISYGELAKRADSASAIRAAGQACARNAAALFVPCHRVVAATGGLHHYAYGIDRKRALLAHERAAQPGWHTGGMRHARPDDLEPLAGLLARLRALDGLDERSTGVFYRRARAYLHFHVDGDDLYADARFAETFERTRVTTKREQDALLARIRAQVGGAEA